MFVYTPNFFRLTKICPRTHSFSLKSFGSVVVCSLGKVKTSIYKGGNASVGKIPRFCRLLENKLEITEPNDCREEKCVPGHILVEQKKLHCKQTADGLLDKQKP